MNVTKIPMNEDTKKKITFVRDKLVENGVDIYAMENHDYVHRMFNELFKEYRNGKHGLSKPNMYALYLSLGSDLSIVEIWQDVQDQFRARYKVNCPEAPAYQSCICGQKDLASTYYMGRFSVGADCIGKYCIKEDAEEIDEYDREFKRVRRNAQAKRKREIKKAEMKKMRDDYKKKKEEQQREYMELRRQKEEEDRLWKEKEKKKYDEMMAPILKKQEEERQERLRIEAEVRAELQKQREEEQRKIDEDRRLREEEDRQRQKRRTQAKHEREEREVMAAEEKRQRKIDKYNNRTPIQIWQDLRHQYYIDNIDPSAGYVPEWKLYDEFENKFPPPK